MTQFASTLYPQTNPTNPYLLLLRDELALNPNIDRNYFVSELVDDMNIEDGFPELNASRPVRDHTRRVLTRLAALTG